MAAPWLLLGWLFHSCSMATPWMAAPRMAAYSEQVKKCWLFCWLQASQEILIILLTLSNSRYAGYFADFEHFKNLPHSKTPLEETGCLSNFQGYLSMSPALHSGFSDLWRSPPALSSTPTPFGCLLFLIVQASSFLIHPLFSTQLVRPPLATYP